MICSMRRRAQLPIAAVQVRTAVGDCRDPARLLAQKTLAAPGLAGRGAAAACATDSSTRSTLRTAEMQPALAGRRAHVLPEAGRAPAEDAVRRLEEEFDLREWRGESHLVTVDAERRLQAQVRSLLRRLALDGSALVLRDQVRRTAALHLHLCATLSPRKQLDRLIRENQCETSCNATTYMNVQHL